jgi:hypothetical protein
MIDCPPSYPATWQNAGLAGLSARGWKAKSWPQRFVEFLATQTEILRGDDFLTALPVRRAMPLANSVAAQQR